MSFISIEFIVFFIIVTSLYFAFPYGWRWSLLMVASYFFYAYWNASYLLLILFSTMVDYVAARVIDATPTEQAAKRRAWLAASITTNLGTLFIFKYFNFFNDSIAVVLASLNIPYTPSTLDVLLPVGISFYTFQSMAYTIDVYRGRLKAEKHAGIFATFVAFFPQLVAGPIERAPNLLPQFRQRFNFDYERVVAGLRQVLWGAFKKMVIADRLAIYVNVVYNDVGAYSGWPLLMATFFFAFQIYCDFSGYSDIAIGTAKVLGFDLMQNFRQPYLARSVREFWRRWHISLSTWFRDYLYIPLGGNRVSFGRNLLNLFIVFVVSGLWHGAAWTFVIWGGLHGVYIVAESLWQKRGGRILPARTPAWLGALLAGAFTFALVCFAWIFFRANSIEDALYILRHLFVFGRGLDSISQPFAGALLSAQTELFIALGLIGLLWLVDFADNQRDIFALWRLSPAFLRWAAYYALTAAIGFSLLYSSNQQDFIYFQF